MDVKSIISPKVDFGFTINRQATPKEASELMWENAIGAALVTDQGAQHRR